MTSERMKAKLAEFEKVSYLVQTLIDQATTCGQYQEMVRMGYNYQDQARAQEELVTKTKNELTEYVSQIIES